MTASKLQNKREFVKWYQEGKTYQWIIDKYMAKYGIVIGNGTISNWVRQCELEPRSARNLELIPWYVLPEHSISHDLNMLRAEGRRRAGKPVAPRTLARLEVWLDLLEQKGEVVDYDPTTEQGWKHVPRRKGDKDIVRKPETSTRKRGVRS